MRLHLTKKGIRVIGIAESFYKNKKMAIITGVVMRADRIIDGINFVSVTVGGLDSTEKIIKLVKELDRKDVSAILLNGTIISWYNIVDLEEVFLKIGLPVIALSYRETKGIEKYILENFSQDAHERITILRRNGEREKIKIKSGFWIYINIKGIDKASAKKLINKFINIGKYPEPIRVARLISHNLLKKLDNNLFS